jgi:hypothetical protein
MIAMEDVGRQRRDGCSKLLLTRLRKRFRFFRKTNEKRWVERMSWCINLCDGKVGVLL